MKVAQAHRYARDIVAEKIPAYSLAQLACKRHLEELKRYGRKRKTRGLWFDEDEARRWLDFFRTVLRISDSESPDGTRPFILEPFEIFLLCSLFGWKKGPHRRFRTAYVEIGKGNGKTPVAAGIGLGGLILDRMREAQIYSAAVTREQASKVLFRDAELMVEASPSLSRIVESTVGNLAVQSTASFFRPVSREGRSLDGKRVHMALIDELHEHPDSVVVDKMRAGTKKDPNSLIFQITNSGYDRDSVCYRDREYSRKVLRGAVKNDAWFAYVCGLDEDDDWRDPRVWVKANPGLGTILPKRYLEEQVAEAVGMPAKENIVKRLNFCVWTEQADQWIPAETWDACDAAASPEPFSRCFGGLTLVSNTNLATLILVFPGEVVTLRAWFWCPEAEIQRRRQEGLLPFGQWVDHGFIEETPGDITDYAKIRSRVREIGEQYRIEQIAFNSRQATQLVSELGDDGFEMVAVGTDANSFISASKEFEARVRSGRFAHGANPVLRWMALNAAVKHDPAGNFRPDWKSSSDRIDGVIGMILALSRLIVDPGRRVPRARWV